LVRNALNSTDLSDQARYASRGRISSIFSAVDFIPSELPS
jgi:hypothetical protein